MRARACVGSALAAFLGGINCFSVSVRWWCVYLPALVLSNMG